MSSIALGVVCNCVLSKKVPRNDPNDIIQSIQHGRHK